MTLFPGVALITGAASGTCPLFPLSFPSLLSPLPSNSQLTPPSLGIGRATSISFALEGCYRISICDRNREGLLETEKYMREVSPHAEIVITVVDMLEEEQIEMMVHEAVAKWGRVDYAVNAAGLFSFSFPMVHFALNSFLSHISHLFRAVV
jgi:NAD(P)-dependent dehydrogenase (short-subunit alcohol dehydrogenase family)